MSKERFDKIDEKLEVIDTRLDEQGKTLIINTQSLIHHIARTDALEERFSPIEKHVVLVNAGIKICGAIIGLAGFVTLILKLLGKIH